MIELLTEGAVSRSEGTVRPMGVPSNRVYWTLLRGGGGDSKEEKAKRIRELPPHCIK